MVKNMPAMQEILLWSLDQEDPLEEGMATHFSTLAWKIPWTEESGCYSLCVLKQLKTTEQLTLHFTSSCIEQIKICCNCGIRGKKLENKPDGLYSIQKLGWLPARNSLPVEIMSLTPLSEMIHPRGNAPAKVYRRLLVESWQRPNTTRSN